MRQFVVWPALAVAALAAGSAQGQEKPKDKLDIKVESIPWGPGGVQLKIEATPKPGESVDPDDIYTIEVYIQNPDGSYPKEPTKPVLKGRPTRGNPPITRITQREGGFPEGTPIKIVIKVNGQPGGTFEGPVPKPKPRQE